MVVASETSANVVIDVASGADELNLGELEAAGAAWSPDGVSIATANLDGSARIFDASTGRQALRFPATATA